MNLKSKVLFIIVTRWCKTYSDIFDCDGLNLLIWWTLIVT